MIKKFLSGVSALLLSISSLFVFAPMTAHAATKTWDGGGSDNNFSTAANWAGDSAPSDGDSVVFPASAASTDYSEKITIDQNISLAGISFTGDSGSVCSGAYKYYSFDGSAILTLSGDIDSTAATGSCWGSVAIGSNIALAADVTVAQGDLTIYFGDFDNPGRTLALGTHSLTGTASSGSGYLSIDLNITGSGAIDSDAVLSLSGDNSGYSGALTAGYNYSVGSATALGTHDLTVGEGTQLFISTSSDATISNNISLVGNPASGAAKVSFGGGNGGCGDSAFTYTLTGTFTVDRDTEVSGACGSTLDIKNPSLGDHKVTLKSGSNATLKVGDTVLEATYVDTVVTDSQPSQSIYVSAYQRYLINGVRGDVSVYEKGILGGTGTVGTINILSGGILAPGLSPGCLTSGNLTIDAGIYRAEIGGATACSGYDQMKVTGTVTLNNDAALEVSQYNSYKSKAGEKYVIISNDGTDAVTGKFKDLAEGATFKVNGYVYKISYVGGDGNDVALTVVSVPAAPDTGFDLLLNNPAGLLATTLIAAGGILMISRRLQPKKVRARR